MRARVGAGLAVGAVGAAAVAIVLLGGGGRAPAPGAAAATRVTGAAVVARRDLVQTDTQAGTISYADPATVYNRLSGTITWLPAVGSLIHPGQPLFDVDDRPAVLLDGDTPAYRALRSGDGAGPDILQLNRNLVTLGFDAGAIVVDDVWQAATTTGVQLLQASLGQAETGVLGLGDAVFLPGPRLIASVSGAIGSTGGGGAPTASAWTTPSDPTRWVSLSTPSRRPPAPRRSRSTRTPAQRRPGAAAPPRSSAQLQAIIALLQAEIAQLRSAHAATPSASPTRSTPSPGASTPASGGGSATAILETTSDRLVVTVALPATSQSEAAVGERVGVQTPSGATLTGVITAVSRVAQSAPAAGGQGGGSGSETVPVSIRLLGHLPAVGLDQASVSVSFAQARARHVLSVPVTALLATSGATYAVQTATVPHRLLPVTVGLFAAGYVQISGAAIHPGLQVTDSQG